MKLEIIYVKIIFFEKIGKLIDIYFDNITIYQL